MIETPVLPLPLDDRFTEALVYGLCESRSLWMLFAAHIEPDAIPQRPARIAYDAANEVSDRLGGTGAGSWVAVLQQVRELYDRGAVSLDDVFSVGDLFERARALRMPEDTVRAVISPILQERAKTAALDVLIGGGDSTAAAQQLVDAARIGESETATVGLVDYAKDLALIAGADQVATLPTPVIPLTAALGGGLCIKNLGCVTAHPAGGKSMYLNHQAAVSVCCGHFTGCLTAELMREHWASRYIASLTGVVEKDLRRGANEAQMAVVRAITELPSRGPITIDRFAAHAYTLENVREYIDACEQKVGEKMRTLILDYADKLSVVGEDSEYKAMRTIYEGLRTIAELRGMWIWTASQPQRSAGGGEENMEGIIRQGELADSQHKLRALDTLISINKRDDGMSRSYWIAKHRLDGGDQLLGPFPQAFSQGRIINTTPLAAAFAGRSFGSWPEDVQVDYAITQLHGAR